MTSIGTVYIRAVNPEQLFSFKTFISFLANLGKTLVHGTSWSAQTAYKPVLNSHALKQTAGFLNNRRLDLTVLIYTVSMGKQQPNLEGFQSCFLAWLDFCENGFRAKEVTRVGRCCCIAVSLEL